MRNILKGLVETVTEIQFKRWANKVLRISDKFVLILHIFFSFLINMDKHGNDKNDFLQTHCIIELDK